MSVMDSHVILVSIAGGLLIGLAVDLYLMGTGRIAGISGIFGNVISLRCDAVTALFLGGLVISPWLAHAFGLTLQTSASPSVNWPKLIVAGLLVGAGTQIGSGCTSGHGVCGLANFSPRSLTA